MLYVVLRFWIRLALYWYLPFREVKRLEKAGRKRSLRGTVVIANHPNSVLDALVLVAFHPSKMYFLARGDVFRSPLWNFLFRQLHMIPIYKRYDDEQADKGNEGSYRECIELFARGGSVLIFPEGVSRNHDYLRRFTTKGLKSLISLAIERGVDLEIQPYLLRYSSFDYLPKAFYLEAMAPVDIAAVALKPQELEQLALNFIERIRSMMKVRLAEIRAMDLSQSGPKLSGLRRLLAKLGSWTHGWYYRFIERWVRRKTRGTIFYDSILFCALMFLYPALLLVFSLVFTMLFGPIYGLLVVLILPFLAFCWVRSRDVQWQKEDVSTRRNHF